MRPLLRRRAGCPYTITERASVERILVPVCYTTVHKFPMLLLPVESLPREGTVAGLHQIGTPTFGRFENHPPALSRALRCD